MARQRLVDQVALHPTPLEVAGDALVAPAVEQPPILGEPLRITGVIDQALLAERPNHVGDHIVVVLPAAKERLDLTGRPLANADRLQRPLKRSLAWIHQRGLAFRGVSMPP